MTAVVKYFNSTLIYFSQYAVGILNGKDDIDLLMSLLKSIADGDKSFLDIQMQLEIAIREYD